MAKPQEPRSPAGGSRRWVTIAAVALALSLAVGIFLAVRSSRQAAAPATSSGEAASQDSGVAALASKVILPALPRRPRPVSLPPEQFPDPSIRRSYEIARNNPQLLEQMPCYCGCYTNPGHTNNLDCFVDKHGET